MVASVNHEIRLRCTHAEFVDLPSADVTEAVGPGNVRVPLGGGPGGTSELGLERGWSYGGVIEVVQKVNRHQSAGSLAAYR
jgi:hypothetical protein